jgi:uncharacterized protein
MKKSTRLFTGSDVFVDTSGFYSLLDSDDEQHGTAQAVLVEARRRNIRFVTTDYVLDETATLMMSRGRTRLTNELFERSLTSDVCRVEWMDPDRFETTRQFFLKHRDQAWSFTDCFSFCLMHTLRLRDALSGDAHFRHAGFNPLLV